MLRRRGFVYFLCDKVDCGLSVMKMIAFVTLFEIINNDTYIDFFLHDLQILQSCNINSNLKNNDGLK